MTATRDGAPWAARSAPDRAAGIAEAVDRVEADAGAIAAQYAATGLLSSASASAETARAIDTLRRLLVVLGPDEEPLPPVAGEVGRRIVLREPAGHVLLVLPEHFPLVICARKVGAALLAGCTCLVKLPQGAEAATGRLLAALASALPAGTLEAATGGAAETQALLRRPDVRHVSFTGSSAVGRAVAKAAAERLLPTTMELSGNSPCLLVPGADVGLAARTIAAAKADHAGQSCNAPAYVLAPAGVAGEVAVLVGRELDRLTAEPDDLWWATSLVSTDAPRRLADAVAGAVAVGGSVVHQGPTSGAPNSFPMTVVLLSGLDESLLDAEMFGPLLLVVPYPAAWTTDDAVDLLNRRPHGLVSYVFGEDKRAESVARRLHVGCVWVNGAGGALGDEPLAGRRESGWGAEGGPQSVDEFRRTKVIKRGVA